MAETPNTSDPHYEETTAPQNPPNSMVNPTARTGWLASSFGVLALVFLIVGAVFAWVFVQRELGKGGRTPDSQTIGTSGAQNVREATPGGFDPAPDADNTRDELEFRGIPDRPQGGTAGTSADDVTDASAVKNAAVGSRVRLTNVAVDRADGDTFWIRAGDATVMVIAPGGTPTVRGGQQVNVTGTIEAAGNTKRIRASRIDVK
jgi:uncharacterized protein YdeI (BOF family)